MTKPKIVYVGGGYWAARLFPGDGSLHQALGMTPVDAFNNLVEHVKVYEKTYSGRNSRINVPGESSRGRIRTQLSGSSSFGTSTYEESGRSDIGDETSYFDRALAAAKAFLLSRGITEVKPLYRKRLRSL